MIRKRVNRTGDGSHPQTEKTDSQHHNHSHEEGVWGWDDRDLTEEDKRIAQIVHQRRTEDQDNLVVKQS